jgi:uncharacterized RDD family membrane protein YckC
MADGPIYCNRCGTQNSAFAKFCANCGTPFGTEPQATATAPDSVTPRPQGPAQPPASAPPAYSPPAYPPPAYPPAIPGARYGGFWIRFVAIIIDILAVSIVVFPIGAVLALALGLAGHAVGMPHHGVHLVRMMVTVPFNFLVNWLYGAGFESSSYQATLGKMALGLKVTDLAGQRISFARATGRHFAKILSGLMLLIGYIMAGFTERKQALHDLIAGTLVVRSSQY